MLLLLHQEVACKHLQVKCPYSGFEYCKNIITSQENANIVTERSLLKADRLLQQVETELL